MFCSECGTSNDDSAVKCTSCGCTFEITQAQVARAPYQIPAQPNDSNFISKLICQNVYSTSRAKWFYQTAETIVNIIVWIGLILGAIVTIYLLSQSVGAGLLSLGSQIFALIGLFIFLIFAKLGLMALGALIRISEQLESNR